MLEMSDGTMRFVQDASILDFMEYYRVSLMNPTVLIGVFIGAMMSFLFCGLTMNAVGRAAQSMVEEVRRQFREIKGILTGEERPTTRAASPFRPAVRSVRCCFRACWPSPLRSLSDWYSGWRA